MKNKLAPRLQCLQPKAVGSVGASGRSTSCASVKFNRARAKISLAVTALSLCLISCESVKPLVTNPKEGFKSLWWDMKMKTREAGEQLVATPDKIWRKLRCDQRELPYFQIDNNEVIPARLEAGEKINHHMVYSLCPEGPTEIVSTRLTRHIYYKGTVIFQDANANYELKPGRWSVDAFVTVSDKAEPGIYSLEIELNTNKQKVTQNTNFVVVRKSQEDENATETEGEP